MLRLPTLAAAAALSFCTAPPLVSAQSLDLSSFKPFPGDALVGPAPGTQTSPWIARGGAGFLAVWADSRSEWGGEQSGSDVYGLRLDADGAPLDALPFVIEADFGDQYAPRAAWNGSAWLVSWLSQEPNTFFYSTDVQAKRIAADGTVLDASALTVADYESSSSVGQALGSDGSDWVVVSRGSSAGPETAVRGYRVSAQGQLLDPGGVELIAAGSPLVFSWNVVSAQGEYLLTWERGGNLDGRRFASDLSPIGSSFGVPGTTVGSNGSEYLVTWNTGSSLVASRMSIAGLLTDPAGVPIAPSASITTTALIDWDGSQWWTSWQNALTGILVARIDAAGAVLDPNGVAIDPAFEDEMGQLRIAGRPGGGAEVIWVDRRSGGFTPEDVWGVSITSAGVVGGGAPISLSAPIQTQPAIAAGSDGFLTPFLSLRSGSMRVLAHRLDAYGNPLDPEPLELADTTALSVSPPEVAWNGQVYLVVWGEDGTLLGRRVRPNGQIVDASPIVVMDGISPAVSALGDVFLVVGTHFTTSAQFYHPFAARVQGSTGAVLDATPLQLGQYFAKAPNVTTFGGRWLATWQRNFSHDNPQAEMMAAFVDANGTSPGSFQLLGFGGSIDVAASATEALFVWRANSLSNATNEILMQRMLPDGSFPDGTGGTFLCDAPDRQLVPRVAWDGTQFVSVWEDMREAAVFFDERTDVYGARIAPGATSLDPNGVAIDARSVPVVDPALDALGGNLVVVLAAIDEQAALGSYRVGARAIYGAEPGVPTCFGDGSGAFCPCGNHSATPGEGCRNSTGVGAVLEARGSNVVVEDELTLHVTQARPDKTGVFLQGATLIASPFRDGLLCTGDPTVRLEFVSLDSAGAASSSVPIAATGGVLPGQTRYYQFWFRDGGPAAPCGTGSNLSGGYRVDWQ